MNYIPDTELAHLLSVLINGLGLDHIPPEQVKVIRSRGTKGRRTLARIHTLSRALQEGLGMKPHYVIEVISETFDRLSSEEQTKTLIHELLHIPRSFGGGFRHHKSHVNKRTVERAFKQLSPHL